MRRGSADSSRMDAPHRRPMGLGPTIENLLRILDSVRHRPPTKRVSSDSRPSCWQDEDYDYIELSIENLTIPYCDISVVDGKVFIRVVRDDELDDAGSLVRPLLTSGIVSIDTPIEV